MTLTLYTAPTGNGNKPKILLSLLNVKYTLHLFPWPTPEIKKEWYLKINPNGLIPLIVDGDVTLYESNAILLYIAETYDKEGKFSYKLDKNPIEYWQQVQWLFFQSTQYTAAWRSLIALIFSNSTNEEDFKKALDGYDKVYAVLEDQLKKSKNIVGEKFSIADVVLVAAHHRLLGVTVGTEYEYKHFENKFPVFHQWYQNSLAIPGVSEALNKESAYVVH